MAAMAKGERPYDAAAFARHAEIVAFMSKLPLEGFIPGSDTGETKAKPEIWLDMDDFKAKLEKMQPKSPSWPKSRRAAISMPARRSSERPARPARRATTNIETNKGLRAEVRGPSENPRVWINLTLTSDPRKSSFDTLICLTSPSLAPRP